MKETPRNRLAWALLVLSLFFAGASAQRWGLLQPLERTLHGWVEPLRAYSWPEGVQEVRIPHRDESGQPAMMALAKEREARPLVIGLHVWGGSYKHGGEELAREAMARGWHFLYPDIQGPNRHPQACCSDRVVQDIDDAIAFVRTKAKVDETRLAIVGASGGGYAALCHLAKGREKVTTYSIWVPITDLDDWETHLRLVGSSTWQDVMDCTESEGQLNRQEARKRSPLFMNPPPERLVGTSVRLYAGITDGLSGSVPIRQTLLYYNHLAGLLPGTDAPPLLGQDELWHLVTRRTALPGEAGQGRLGYREVLLQRQGKGLSLVLFDGGHEFFPGPALEACFDGSTPPVSAVVGDAPGR